MLHTSIPDKVIYAIKQMPSLDEPPEHPSSVKGRGGNSDYREFIRSQRCVSCLARDKEQQSHTEHHHILTKGMALRCADEMGIPLCHDCHIGKLHGKEGKKTFLEKINFSSYEGIAKVYLAYFCYQSKGSPKNLRRATFYFKKLLSNE